MSDSSDDEGVAYVTYVTLNRHTGASHPTEDEAMVQYRGWLNS